LNKLPFKVDKFSPVDKEIVDFLIDLNHAGLITYSSCAGHQEGHMDGYVTFRRGLSIEDRKIIKDLMTTHGIEGRTRFQNYSPESYDYGHGSIMGARVNFVSQGPFRVKEID